MSNPRMRAIAFLVGTTLCVPAAAQVTKRVSVSTAGVQGNGTSQSWLNSADGSLTIMDSVATNLVPGDTNGVGDIFVYDSVNETMERVSVGTGGTEANAASVNNAISPGGRYAVFASAATNLVAGDTNGFQDIFVRDRLGDTTERVSVDSGGAQGDAASGVVGSGNPLSISAAGRYVGFDSLATNLVAGDTNSVNDVFVRDLQLGTTERVSVATGGAQGNGTSSNASLSADGRYVVFLSQASNLVAGDTNGIQDVFVRDRVGMTTERVSVDSAETQGNGVSSVPSISNDGRYVIFDSTSTNLVAGDTNGVLDIFVRDLASGTTVRVSVDSGGGQSDGISTQPSISADGRFVTFRSEGTNLVPGDTNGTGDAFVRDLLAGTTWRVSVDSSGNESNGESSWPWISGDGGHVCFMSDATNLVSGDTNGVMDVFVHSIGAGGTEAESSGLGGVPSNGNSSAASISADERYVAFESHATNLVVGDTNGWKDIFVRDRQTATTERVSISSGGAEGDGDSSNPAISSDGRYVAFDSVATNLVAGDTNAVADVFVRDRQLGTTTRVSVGSEGDGPSVKPSISADGSAIAFESAATNLVVGDTNAALDVFVRDLQASTTSRVSVDSAGVQGNGDSANASISADGLLVAFDSAAGNLAPGDSNLTLDVFVRDRQLASTVRVSVDSGGTQGAGSSSDPSISGDGRFVAFASDASNLVGGDTNLTLDVFVHYLLLSTTERVSVDSGGTQGASSSEDPSISADGRYVAFASLADNIVSDDTNLTMDVFVRDTAIASTRRVSVDSGGTQGLGASSRPSISADGLLVVFDSDAANLVDGDTNGSTDVFLHDDGNASAFETFCPGDGTVAHCPCSNSGMPGRGCENSAGTGGALLTVTGVASLSADTVQFTSSGEAPTAFSLVQPKGLSILLQGSGVIAPIAYGDGLRCAGGELKRLYTKISVDGAFVAPVAGDLSISARSAQLSDPIPLGSTRPYQVYYRDGTAGFCPGPSGGSFNMSNGFLVAWGS
ncbi:MAG: TolB family protein [Planctomycetota bacterium]